MLAPRLPSRSKAVDIHFQVLKHLLRKHLLDQHTDSAISVAKLLFRHSENFGHDAKPLYSAPDELLKKPDLELHAVAQIGLELLRRQGVENRIGRWLMHLKEMARGDLGTFILVEFIMYLVRAGKKDEAAQMLTSANEAKTTQDALLLGYQGLLYYMLWLDAAEQETQASHHWSQAEISQLSFSQSYMHDVSIAESQGDVTQSQLDASQIRLEGEGNRASTWRRAAVKSLAASIDLDPRHDMFLLVYLQLLRVGNQTKEMDDRLKKFWKDNPKSPNAHRYLLEFLRTKGLLEVNSDICLSLLRLHPTADYELALQPVLDDTRTPDIQAFDHIMRYLDTQPRHAACWEKLREVTTVMLKKKHDDVWKVQSQSRRDWWPSFVFPQLTGMKEDAALALERSDVLIRPQPGFVDAVQHFSPHWLVLMRLFPRELLEYHADLKLVLAQSLLEEKATKKFLGQFAYQELLGVKTSFNMIAPTVVMRDNRLVLATKLPRKRNQDVSSTLADLKELLYHPKKFEVTKQERNKRILDLLVEFVPNKPGKRTGNLSVDTLRTQHKLDIPVLFVKYLEKVDPARHRYIVDLKQALEAYRSLPGARTPENQAKKEKLASACHDAAVNVRKHVLDDLSVLPKLLDKLLGITIAHLVIQPIPTRGFNKNV